MGFEHASPLRREQEQERQQEQEQEEEKEQEIEIEKLLGNTLTRNTELGGGAQFRVGGYPAAGMVCIPFLSLGVRVTGQVTDSTTECSKRDVRFVAWKGDFRPIRAHARLNYLHPALPQALKCTSMPACSEELSVLEKREA